MQQGLGLDISGIEATLKHFAELLHSGEELAVERLRADLLKKGVFGDGVIPNVEADTEWRDKRREMLKAVKEELAAHSARSIR